MKRRYSGGVISSTQPTISFSSASGFYTTEQQLQNISNWPKSSLPIVEISPTLSGKTQWNFLTDGPINITSGSYTITPASTFITSIKLWGQGGKAGIYTGGAGGALTASLTLTAGQPYYLTFAGGGAGGGTSAYGTGGNFAGIFLGSSALHANALAIAAGGGAGGYDDGGRGATGGAGGHPSGSTSGGYTGTLAGGGTQSAGGTAGGGSNPGTPGSALQGGTGGSGSSYQGGGGGGGYYGGGGGGLQASWAGAGGGGGSNYANTSILTSVVQYSGSGTTPGNSSDSIRSGAGTGGSGSTGASGGVGRIYITN